MLLARPPGTGTKLHTLYTAYASATPPVHIMMLGRSTFGKMLNALYNNIGPHKNGECTVSGLYLLRKEASIR